MGDGPHEAILHKIIGIGVVSDQHTGVSAQSGEFVEQSLSSGIHDQAVSA